MIGHIFFYVYFKIVYRWIKINYIFMGMVMDVVKKKWLWNKATPSLLRGRLLGFWWSDTWQGNISVTASLNVIVAPREGW